MATASGSGDVLRPSEGKTRFLRLTRLLICGGTKVMRELFNDKIPPANLATCLGSPDVKRRLKKKKQDRFLTLRQWQVLYPSSGAGPVQSTSFDISLLFKLLRENVISGLSPPSTGWDKLPSLIDLSLPADMARIKYYRNIICHIDETMEIEESDFSDYWKEIKDALLRIVGHYAASGSSTVNDWEKDIDNLLTDPLTEAELESVEELKKWYLEDMQLKEMLNENNKLLKGLISMNSKDFNIRCAVRIAGVGAWLGGNLYVLDSLKDNPEALIKFVKYSIVPSGLVLVSFAFGSIKITVRVETLEALDEILTRNKAGRLEKDLEKVLITEKMKNLANGQQIKLTVQIDEQKLMAIRKHLKKGKKLVPGRTSCESPSFFSIPHDVMASLSDQTMIDMFVNVFEGEAHYNKQEYDEAISYFKKILATAEKYGDEDSKMYAYQVLGKAYYFKNEYADSIFYGKKCLAMAEHFGDKKNQTEACVTLGAAHLKKQEYDDAIDYGKKGLTMAQECGDKHDEMETCMTLGLAHSKKNEYDDAIFYLQNFLAMAQQSGNKEDEVIAYIEIGTVHSKKQEYDDAISYGEKSLAIAKECGDKENEMKAYSFLRDARLGKEYDDAIRYSKKCLAMAQKSGSKEDEMDAYVKLGHALMMKQEYDDAILYGEKCLSLAQGCGDKKSGMAACKILSNAHLNKQEYDDCISYEKKFLSLAQDSDDKKDLMAETYITLGSVYLEKGEYDDAIAYSKKGLAMAQECGDKASERLAYKSLGRAHSERKEDDDAIFYTKKFLAMAQECGDKDDEMKAYKSLGNLFWNKEEYDEAISYYKKRLTITQQSNDKVAEMKTYLLIGNTHLTKEEYEEAILCGRECLAIAQDCGDKEEEIDAYSLIGTAHWKNNAYDDAYSCFTEGKKIAMNLKDDSRTSTFQSYLSMTYEEVGIETPGIFDTDVSYAINFKRFNEHEIKWVFSYSYYVLHKQKYEYKQAISRLEEAEATLPTTQPKNDSIECRKKRWLCKQGIAEMYVKLEQYDQAMKYQQEALDVAVTRSHQAASHFSRGKLYYNKPDRQLENALKSLDKSLKCYELIFQDLKENDRFKIFFVDKYKEVYKMVLKVLVETNKKEEALALSDRYRAKALKDLLVSSYGMNKDPTAEETDYLQYADVQSLVSCRNYSLLFYSSYDEKLCTFLVQAENALEFSVQHFEYCDKCLDELVNKAYDDMKVMRQVVYCEDQSLDIKDDSEENKNPKEDELTRMLTQQREERLTEQCRLICGCRGNLSVKSDDASKNTQKMKHHKDDRCLVEEDESAVNPEGPSGLEILYNKLIYNIKCLFKKEEILIIPEGPLCKVPFAALQDPETGQYLSETKRIRMAPSMATLKFLQEAYPKEHTRAKEALVIGDPLVGQVMMTESAMEIKELPGARKEANHIGSILGVQPLLGADATKTAVIKRLQEGASIVHIAAHGNLKKATVFLAPAPELRENKKIPDEEDYMLTMADVQQAQVRAQLVVLSCCYTGRGEIKAEGVVGLCRAFLASGARAVMGSLWAVHDDATWVFMKTFYKYLKDGKSASTSLHLTMKDMREKTNYSEPKFWAPFFLMGDDVTIKFED